MSRTEVPIRIVEMGEVKPQRFGGSFVAEVEVIFEVLPTEQRVKQTFNLLPNEVEKINRGFKEQVVATAVEAEWGMFHYPVKVVPTEGETR